MKKDKKKLQWNSKCLLNLSMKIEYLTKLRYHIGLGVSVVSYAEIIDLPQFGKPQKKRFFLSGRATKRGGGG